MWNNNTLGERIYHYSPRPVGNGKVTKFTSHWTKYIFCLAKFIVKLVLKCIQTIVGWREIILLSQDK